MPEETVNILSPKPKSPESGILVFYKGISYYNKGLILTPLKFIREERGGGDDYSA